jgi:predicted dehydrogenase
MRVALIGLGQWGSRLAPKLIRHPSVSGLYCYDVDKTRCQNIDRNFAGAKIARNYESILTDKKITAVIIATPVQSHYELARQALEHGKHVLLEKPLTNSVDDAQNLVNLASSRKLRLMVDHITVYGGPSRSIRRIIEKEELGKILYLDAVRANLGKIQTDVSVVWDLAIHEFALIDYLLGEMPQFVSANGSAFYTSLDEIANVSVRFESGITGSVYVSWLSPTRMRRLIIGGRKKMLVFDDTAAEAKVKLYDRGVEQRADESGGRTIMEYRDDGFHVLDHELIEPMVAAINEFLESIEKDREPLTNGVSGLRCVKILQAVEESIKQGGKSVRLS